MSMLLDPVRWMERDHGKKETKLLSPASTEQAIVCLLTTELGEALQSVEQGSG
jgi:hypothetical protein